MADMGQRGIRGVGLFSLLGSNWFRGLGQRKAWKSIDFRTDLASPANRDRNRLGKLHFARLSRDLRPEYDDRQQSGP